MAYVPGCSADVFVSYAHRDNEDGWVSRLKLKLVERLNPFLAGRAEVWSDECLRTGADFRYEIQQKLRDTSVFIAIVSPSYLDSDFSIVNELDWFLNQGGKDIIQLVKVPLEVNQVVPEPAAQYRILHDKVTGQALDGAELERSLDEVVWEIAGRLRSLREMRPKVYLSQLRNEAARVRWDELRSRLHVEGFSIQPKGVLPSRVPEARIREWLLSSRLSVHLADVEGDPLAALQMEIARKTAQPMLVVPQLTPNGQWDEVVTEVRSRSSANRKPAVYLIYDYHSDHGLVAALPEFIQKHTGCEVYLPEAGEKYHKFRLEASDGILLFRGKAPEDWLRSQEESLLQTAATRSAKQAMWGGPATSRIS